MPESKCHRCKRCAELVEYDLYLVYWMITYESLKGRLAALTPSGTEGAYGIQQYPAHTC